MDKTIEQIKRAHQGDKTAREALVKDNLGLVWSIVRRFAGRGGSFLTAHSNLRRQLFQRRLPPKRRAERFPRCPEPLVLLFDGTTDLDDPVIPEKTFDLPRNHRHRIRRKTHLI